MANYFSNIIDIRRMNEEDCLPNLIENHKWRTISYSSGFVFYERSLTQGITNVNKLDYKVSYKSNVR